ncbi:FAD-dependent oxidoreductase [Flavivirga algicola]|uniref:FAD-dependent oxidoreductase n=1 Tax=Flavivirga algicola TaxID=2729136 RepID=A0ABX1RY80_9FLAO|nr:FAD-dependent oxidoreductase [Flavivirga algicola]NMH87965.1 FAD-dependent oxidoreductase [Flavivirga algicola]
MHTYSKELQVAKSYDIIVVGSGSAGSPAAIAAARKGAKVLLLERLGFLGGTSTAVLDTFYGYYTPGERSTKVVGGIADDVVKGLGAYKAYLERPNSFGAGTGVTYHPEYLKVVWEQLARQAGCDILLNAWVQDTVTEGTTIKGLVVATKSGLQYITCKQVIDATGDADICHQAGIPYELAGLVDPAQTLTTTFKMVNVDMARRKTISKPEINALMEKAAATGKFKLPRKEGSDHITPVNHMTATIMTRLTSFEKDSLGHVINATDPKLWSEAEMKGRLQAIEYIRFLKEYVPGYEKSELSTFGVQIGVRETRRIEGYYRMTADDVLGAKQFEDQIGLCGAPMEDHHDGEGVKWQYIPNSEVVGIPYRTLVPQESSNLLVAGRCFSANHVAHSSVRSMAQCMVMGEAAGVAATMSIENNCAPIDIDTNVLRSTLKNQGAIIEAPYSN